jgi:hypothetical protein
MPDVEVYCSRCNRPTTVVKYIVNYACPRCGATFAEAEIEELLKGAKTKQDEQEPSA